MSCEDNNVWRDWRTSLTARSSLTSPRFPQFVEFIFNFSRFSWIQRNGSGSPCRLRAEPLPGCDTGNSFQENSGTIPRPREFQENSETSPRPTEFIPGKFRDRALQGTEHLPDPGNSRKTQGHLPDPENSRKIQGHGLCRAQSISQNMTPPGSCGTPTKSILCTWEKEMEQQDPAGTMGRSPLDVQGFRVAFSKRNPPAQCCGEGSNGTDQPQEEQIIWDISYEEGLGAAQPGEEKGLGWSLLEPEGTKQERWRESVYKGFKWQDKGEWL